MTIYFTSDHAGLKLRKVLLAHVRSSGQQFVDLGPKDAVSVDYPDFGVRLALALQQNDQAFGIAICGSGIGISIALNRFSWIRAALVNQPEAAAMAKQHNNANVLVFGERMITSDIAIICVDHFLSAKFDGGRHHQRVKKLSEIGLKQI